MRHGPLVRQLTHLAFRSDKICGSRKVESELSHPNMYMIRTQMDSTVNINREYRLARSHNPYALWKSTSAQRPRHSVVAYGKQIMQSATKD